MRNLVKVEVVPNGTTGHRWEPRLLPQSRSLCTQWAAGQSVSSCGCN